MPYNRLLDLHKVIAKKGQANLAEDIAANLRLIDARHGIQRDHRLNDALALDVLLHTSNEPLKLEWQRLLATRYLAFADLERNKDNRSKYDAYLTERKAFLKSLDLSENNKRKFRATLKQADAYLLERCANQSLPDLDGVFLKRLLSLGSDLRNIIINAFSKVAPPQQQSFQKMAQLGLQRQNPKLESDLNLDSDLDLDLPELALQPETPELVLEANQSVFIDTRPDTSNDEAIARASQEFDDMDAQEELQEWEDRLYALSLQETLEQEMQDEAYALRLSMLPDSFDREELLRKKHARQREKELAAEIEAELEMVEEEALEMSLSLELEANEMTLGYFGICAMACSIELSYTFVALHTLGLGSSRPAPLVEQNDVQTMGLFAICQSAMFFTAAPRPSPYNNRPVHTSLEENEQPGFVF